ncbi:MAG: phenylalanine--tRNA ligase subunit beta [Alphaproteobacteria bacterium]|nr:phenylalanine--tRNA ligase subunit beta [Alphaproteobacteria bacterium]
MRFTLSWLGEHLDAAESLERLSESLIALGLEVEAIIDRAAALAPFVVARVIEARAHPNADRLKVCVVDAGGAPLQVVCGAPNARAGMKAVFAPPGTVIPGTGLQLTRSTMRGIESNGMLLSERELGLGEDHAGIIDLDAAAVVGTPAAGALGLDDPVIDVAVTPNRPDCLGVRGIARDLAAAGQGTLKPRAMAAIPGRFQSPIGVRLAFSAETAAACPLFCGRYIRGVRNGPSPRWLQDRLKAIGLRPISALVDITNFVTMDLGRPLHVFDADTLAGGIHVRLSRTGERIAALNGRTYVLDDQVTVIADDDGVLGLGGVIGGEGSGCRESTVNVFVESALFDPLRTAASGRRLGIESDARYRFERGVDPESAWPGIEVATEMILALCGGEPSEAVSAGAVPAWRRSIRFRPARVQHLGGLDIPEDETLGILASLGFAVAGAGAELAVTPPSWRSDIHGEADLVEEVVRVHGYDRVPAVPLSRTARVTRPAVAPRQRRTAMVRRALAARGLCEAVTWSFLAARQAALFGGGDPALHLSNPISADLDTMRPSPLPNLIAAAARNLARGHDRVALFEIGAGYADTTPDGQSLIAAGIRCGAAAPRHWAAAERAPDVYDAKADLVEALQAAGASVEGLQHDTATPTWYHGGQAGAVKLGPKTVLGHFGVVHPRVLEALDVAAPLVAFELYLDRLPAPRARGSRMRPPLATSDLPAVERDFAFVVEQAVSADAVVRAARGADRALIVDVAVFDVYVGAAVGAGRKSLAVAVRLRPTERTLTEAEIEAVSRKIIAAVGKTTGGTLRT